MFDHDRCYHMIPHLLFWLSLERPTQSWFYETWLNKINGGCLIFPNLTQMMSFYIKLRINRTNIIVSGEGEVLREFVVLSAVKFGDLGSPSAIVDLSSSDLQGSPLPAFYLRHLLPSSLQIRVFKASVYHQIFSCPLLDQFNVINRQSVSVGIFRTFKLKHVWSGFAGYFDWSCMNRKVFRNDWINNNSIPEDFRMAVTQGSVFARCIVERKDQGVIIGWNGRSWQWLNFLRQNSINFWCRSCRDALLVKW